jgi:hypothetical protein
MGTNIKGFWNWRGRPYRKFLQKRKGKAHSKRGKNRKTCLLAGFSRSVPGAGLEPARPSPTTGF